MVRPDQNNEIEPQDIKTDQSWGSVGLLQSLLRGLGKNNFILTLKDTFDDQ